MSVTRVGATKRYSDNWENIFGGGKRRSASKKAAPKSAKKSPKKAASKVAKKKSKRKGR